MNYKENMDFENEVRRIARAKWPSAQYSGSAILDGRERDGVFETEELVNFIEATTSMNAGKAKDDTKKLFKLVAEYNKSGALKIAYGWFITKNEPTADQRAQVSEHGKGQIRALSLEQFQQTLMDVRAYIAARENHNFGSVTAFKDSSKNPEIDFIEIGLSKISDGSVFHLSNIENGLLDGGKFVLIGQYGAGKSMVLRELFFKLKNRYILKTSSKFPIYINLRDHSGQKDPVEILERHARNIGFEQPAAIIRAWRAGFCILLIDGFDEVATFGVQGSWKKLRDLRTRSLEGIRRLIKDSSEIGVVTAGRSHYFENNSELSIALGLREPEILALDEFSPQQVADFLARFPNNQLCKLPDWLPTRPLLLGYLASKGLLDSLATTDNDAIIDAVSGWDYLLGRIYDREEMIETNLDSLTLRRILERAATLARVSEDGLGPITRQQLFSIFTEVCGYEPDEQGILAIQRLPGLGLYRAEDESRCFIDRELADVCTGSELLRFINNTYEIATEPLWLESMNACDRPISQIGAEFVIKKISPNANFRRDLNQVVSFLNSRDDIACVRGDISVLLNMAELNLDSNFVVNGMNYGKTILTFDKESGDLSKLTLTNCFFDEIQITPDFCSEYMPNITASLIERIVGRTAKADLPPNKFSEDCEFVYFDSVTTSEAIRATKFGTMERVMLVTLRKLFIQSITGRLESALYRGLDVEERRAVKDILDLLSKHSLATPASCHDGIIWKPNRKEVTRVRRIISAPTESKDSIMIEVRSL